ncbi:MAG: glycerol-3-phosphate dehydrogenase [Anaerosolibacter sp.]|uniref:NAD(P)H-dependent glycerol-3-phosphate dehydrogenase n=1 Tax=Anaerosolibacter sp. TaxID=1872527 RepID=UPI002625E35B|nr:NAD(P)-binding domain-containing protein [Anaerosolibacter sp.]MDF2548398.1 glycerol-3-phosphate dehydrogenase [Anaerosolibacter sp.]
MAKVVIIGAGAMGSALTVPLERNNHEVCLWGTELDERIITALRAGEYHPKHNQPLPSSIKTYYAYQLQEAMEDAEIVIVAITSDALAMIFKRVIQYLHEGMIVVSVSKGLEYSTSGDITILPHILEELLPNQLKNKIPIIGVGGPCKAIEVVWESSTSVTYACKDVESARKVKELIMTDRYNIEITEDMVGTEICAAMKNAYAVGLGLAEGFKNKGGFLHNNTKSALFSFAVAEMAILVKALGGGLASVVGLPGIGDLEVTGEAGRNRTLGEVIGAGLQAKDAIKKMQEEDITVEGYSAIRYGYELLKQLEPRGKLSLKEFPLLAGLYRILYEDALAYETIIDILQQCTGKYSWDI